MLKGTIRYFSLVDLFVFITIYFLAQILGGIISTIVTPIYGEEYGIDNIAKIVYIPTYLILVIAAATYRKVRMIVTMSPCRFVKSGRFSANAVLFGMFMMVVVSIICDPLFTLFPIDMSEYVETFTSGNMWITLGVTIIAAPILEEVFFRGILLKDMSVSWGPRSAIFISSFLFALLHFNVIQAIPAFLMGIVMGYIYMRTRRGLSTVILIHIINNLISTVLLFWGFAEESIWEKYLPEGVISDIVFYLSIAIMSIVIARVLIMGMGAKLRSKFALKIKK